MNAYDALPYESLPIPGTAPEHLAVRARLRGLAPPPLEGSRYLEIGCGDGTNLLALASGRPQMRFLGFDPAAEAVALGRRAAEALGLANLELRQAGVEEPGALVEGSEEGSFDFVVAHGVYSWIGEEAQRALLALAARALAPGGLFYLSYNTQPGWALRGAVREHLLRAGFEAPTRAHTEGALAYADLLLSQLPPAGEAEGSMALLRSELERLGKGSMSYLAHEYLSAHNRAFWFSEVAAQMAEVDLAYVGDAYDGQPEGWVPEDLLEALDKEGLVGARREDAVDLLRHRTMRASIFARAKTVPAERPARATLGAPDLEGVWLAGGFRAHADPFNLDPDFEEAFTTDRGLPMRVAHPILKAALLHLGARWPEAYAFADLYEEAARTVRRAGFGEALAEGDRDELRDTLLYMAENAQLHLRGRSVRLRVGGGDRPRASALSRHLAAHKGVLAAPTHTLIGLDPLDRAVLARLDGSLDRQALAETIAEEANEGRLELEGVPAGAGLFRLLPALTPLIEASLAKLAYWGVLEDG